MKRKDYVIIAVTAFMICAAIITYAFKSNSGGITVNTVAVSISEETMMEDNSAGKTSSRGRSSGKSKLTSDEALASRLAVSAAKEQSKLAAASERVASQAALKFDVNTVTKEELMLIDKISEENAEDIIKTREMIGGYAVLEEVWLIPKLTPEKCLILKPHLYVDPATARVDGDIYW